MAKKKSRDQQEQKPRLSAEEIQERKVTMARERNARVMRVNSAVTGDMHNSLKQLDMALQNLKMKLGEPRGVSFEEGIAILNEGKKLAILISDYAAKVSEAVGFRYYEPLGIQELIREGHGAEEKGVGKEKENRKGRGGVIRMEKAVG